MHADRIYVLEKGVLAEMGTHEGLLAEKGLYYAMWRQQIGERKYVASESVQGSREIPPKNFRA
jgi:ATP-binding cassette subfamily B protein